MATRKAPRRSKAKRGASKSSRAKTAKKPKRSTAKKTVRKRGGTKTRRPAAKKTSTRTTKKPSPKAKRPAAKKPASAAVSRPAPARAAVRPATVPPRPAPAVTTPGEEAVGVVTHYFSHLMVAVVELNRGPLALGDKIHLKGHTTDFSQNVESMEVEHQSVMRTEVGQTFGLMVRDQVREHDVVYKVLS